LFALKLEVEYIDYFILILLCKVGQDLLF